MGTGYAITIQTAKTAQISYLQENKLQTNKVPRKVFRMFQ